MAIAVQGRRGTTVQHSTFAGLEGEFTIDLSKKLVVVHDGITPGGYPLALENLSTSPVFLGADALSNGVKGLVPSPVVGDQEKFLKGDGTWSVLPISKVSHANTLYVAKDGNNTDGAGTIAEPFATIQKAIDTALDDQVIFVQPGIYTEDLTILNKRVYIVSSNPSVWVNTRIDGKVSVSPSSSLFMRGIAIRNPGTDATDYCLNLNSSSSCRFDNVAFIKPNMGTAIKITGAQPSTVIFNEAFIEGVVSIAGSQEQTVKFVQISSPNAKFDLMGTNVVTIENSIQIGTVTHESGSLLIRNVGKITKTEGNSIVSSAPVAATNILLIDGVNLIQEDMTWGFIKKTGDCIWAFNNVVRDITNDILMGSRYAYISNSSDIAANHNAVNYNVSGDSLLEHIQGIDTAIGQRVKTSDLSTVALTGSYNDLIDKPVITVDYTELTNTPILGTAAARDAGVLPGNVPYLDAQGKLNPNVIPNAFSGTIAASNVTVDTTNFSQNFGPGDNNLQAILDKLDKMTFSGQTPTYPTTIDSGDAATTSFIETLDGGNASTSSFTFTFDGGNAGVSTIVDGGTASSNSTATLDGGSANSTTTNTLDGGNA